MVLFNHAAHQMVAKIVYYGPGLCGKTTSLDTVYKRNPSHVVGEMVSLNTETDRTLFFDLLPMDMGELWGFRTRLQLYTVPGQVFYNATRKLVLKGVDGVVFVADSQAERLEANRDSLRNLEMNLRELGLEPADLPMVFQWNKRDLPGVVPVEVLERELNPQGRLSFCTVACQGEGVSEALKGITRLTLLHIKRSRFTEAGAPVAAPTPAAAPGPRELLRGRIAAPATVKPPVSGSPSVPGLVLPKLAVPRIQPPRRQAPSAICVPSIRIVPSVAKPASTTESKPTPGWDPDATAV